MNAKSVIFIALGATALGGMPMWLLGAYSPQIVSTFSLGGAQFGAVLGAFFLFSTLTAIPVGRFVNGISWLTGITLTSLFSAVGLLFLAFFSSGIPLLLVGLFIASWANSFSQTSANKGLSEGVPRALAGRAFGLKQAALPLSTFVVGLSVPLFATGDDWRYAFLAIASFAVALGMLALWLLYRRRLHGLVWEGSQVLPDLKSVRAERTRAPRAVVLLAIGSGIATGATMSFAGFLVLFAVSEGNSPQSAALVLALGSFAGIAARIGFGFWADRAKSGHFMLVTGLILGGALGFALLAFSNGLAVLVAGTLLGFALGWAWNGVFHFAVTSSNPTQSAYFTGIIQAAMMAGATVTPPAFGLLSQSSFPLAWLMLSGMMVVAALFIVRGARAIDRH